MTNRQTCVNSPSTRENGEHRSTIPPNQIRDALLAKSESDRYGQSPANVADAVFAVARALNRIAGALDMDCMEHAICMGIRHGLFGVAADAGSTILTLLELKVED